MNEIIVRFFSDLITAHSSLAPVTIFFADYLGWLILGFYLLVLVWRPKGKVSEEFFLVLLATLTAWVAAEAIKHFYLSARPFVSLSDFTPLLRHGANDSFPSTHATVFFAFAFAVYGYRKLLGNLFIAAAALISLARIAAGLHWPSDVICGFILAGIIAMVWHQVFNRYLFSRPN